MTKSSDKPTLSKNNDSKPAFGKNNSNSMVKFDGDSVEYIKKIKRLKID